MPAITWLTAMLDAPTEMHDEQVRFWRAVTGSDLSARRGPDEQWATLVPADGDAHLKVQRLAGASRVHLDVHVDDVEQAVAEAVTLGATRVDDVTDVAVLRSPGGFVFCVVGHAGGRRTSPVDWGSHRSLVDQVCLDAPADRYDAEEAFWAAYTGRPLQDRADDHGLRALDRQPGLPFRIVLQPLGDALPDQPVGAHLDLATDDRDAEVARHEALGASVVRRTKWWTTLRDPAGLDYCITDRDPATGLLR